MSEHPELHWEETAFRVSDNGGGSTGQTQVDVLINGSSAFVSSGTEDLRPAVDYDAADLVDRSAIHETAVIRRGDLVEVQLSEEPTGGTPTDLEVLLVCRVA